MPEIKPCDICGKVPSLLRSHSSGMISHQCKDYHSGWSSPQKAISNWNSSNSLGNSEVTPSASHNIASTKSLCLSCICDCVLEEFSDNDDFVVSKCARHRT